MTDFLMGCLFGVVLVGAAWVLWWEKKRHRTHVRKTEPPSLPWRRPRDEG